MSVAGPTAMVGTRSPASPARKSRSLACVHVAAPRTQADELNMVRRQYQAVSPR